VRLPEGFHSQVSGAPLVVLTDFDYTISQVDVGDLICRTLSPPSAEVLERFKRREVGSRVLWQDTMAKVNRDDALALADSVRLDPTFPAFVELCEQRQIPLAVVSDGFGFYIRHLLMREGLQHLTLFSNELPTQGELHFLNGNPACDFCGCCKALVAKQVRESGANVIYIGDGISDLFAAGYAHWVFAKSRLARHLQGNGSPYYPFDSFADVTSRLRADFDRFRMGSAPHRATLGPDPICRF
jgi:2-hydroxy-3-keto-5-methylthiopentenyl-1-phosphate phosphatase